jgi:photosystem II stability/assembly factor-like uncharacterized protein
VALGMLMASPSRAHAPPLGARVLAPASSEIGSEEVIVTNRGLVFRDRDTGNARLLCNEALYITTTELPHATLLGDGGLLVATSRGLRLSRDRGCSWSDVGQMETTNTPALAADPGDPSRVFVATYDSDAPGLHETRDAGASFRLSYATGENDYVFSLLIAERDPGRVYATLATYGLSGPPEHSLLRTRDGGERWERLPLPLIESDYKATAAAVDPENPDTLIVYTVANSPGLDSSRLLVSRDAGDTFEVRFERPEIRGAGYAEGGTLWVAARDGLYGSNADLSAFAQTSLASELGCVGERAGSLFVCGHYAGANSAQFGIGVSTDGGQSFERWLDFSDVTAPVECSPESLTTSLCARPWLDWQTEMLGGVPSSPGAYGPVGAAPATMENGSSQPASGAIDAADDQTTADDPPTPAGCSLGQARRPPPSSGAAGSIFALLTCGWVWRARANTRPRRRAHAPGVGVCRLRATTPNECSFSWPEVH